MVTHLDLIIQMQVSLLKARILLHMQLDKVAKVQSKKNFTELSKRTSITHQFFSLFGATIKVEFKPSLCLCR
ncbi:hypothetical protein AMTR_s00046p00093070 [Amborella trichopoda]|uniref:Uncharacterized protein n=1 Tax=Amborella trichopoda TaxID=13333 RepID=U5D6A5_AMBTC|nr:hypothetical protein AMTR_s00046p00093070 [Amborella trichopoda]